LVIVLVLTFGLLLFGLVFHHVEKRWMLKYCCCCCCGKKSTKDEPEEVEMTDSRSTNLHSKNGFRDVAKMIIQMGASISKLETNANADSAHQVRQNYSSSSDSDTDDDGQDDGQGSGQARDRSNVADNGAGSGMEMQVISTSTAARKPDRDHGAGLQVPTENKTVDDGSDLPTLPDKPVWDEHEVLPDFDAPEPQAMERVGRVLSSTPITKLKAAQFGHVDV
jgi:hypothetical protein